MSTLAEKLHGRVQFVFVYGQEFHPRPELEEAVVTDGPNPLSSRPGERYAERQKRARGFQHFSAQRARRLLVDEDGDDDFTKVQAAYHALLYARTFIIDRRGRIVWVKSTAEAADVEKALGELFPKLASPSAPVRDSNEKGGLSPSIRDGQTAGFSHK